MTFGLMKLGLLMGMGYEYAGEVSVVDIGFPKQAIDFVEPRLYTYDPKDVEELLPHRKRDSHKGTYGKVGIIAGSKIWQERHCFPQRLLTVWAVGWCVCAP